jgi:hypothetical protein
MRTESVRLIQRDRVQEMESNELGNPDWIIKNSIIASSLAVLPPDSGDISVRSSEVICLASST